MVSKPNEYCPGHDCRLKAFVPVTSRERFAGVDEECSAKRCEKLSGD